MASQPAALKTPTQALPNPRLAPVTRIRLGSDVMHQIQLHELADLRVARPGRATARRAVGPHTEHGSAALSA